MTYNEINLPFEAVVKRLRDMGCNPVLGVTNGMQTAEADCPVCKRRNDPAVGRVLGVTVSCLVRCSHCPPQRIREKLGVEA